MIPKRKPVAANRHTRRAEGIKLIKIKHVKSKRGGPPSSPGSLVEALKQIIAASDSSVVMSPGLLMGEKGWLFHRGGEFAYAVTSGKTRVTLHLPPPQCAPKTVKAYAAQIPNGDFTQGRVRFKLDAKVDLCVIAQLIQECAKNG